MTENATDDGLGQKRGVLNGEWEGRCVLGMPVAQVSAGQCGAVDRAGQWWWTWHFPVLALSPTSCVTSGKALPSLGLSELLI